MKLTPHTGGGVLEPTQNHIDEFIPNPHKFEINQLDSGDVELSFIAEDGGLQRLILPPRAQIRVTRLLLDCLRNQGLVA